MTKRGYLIKREYDAMLERQGGVCASPSCSSVGPFDADHSTSNAWAGKPVQAKAKRNRNEDA